MISDNVKHKESKISKEFLEWYSDKCGYKELFTDIKTTGGDPFDSAGYIGEELVLIEFKTSISKNIVLHKNSNGSSIERKIAQVLYQVYYEKSAGIFNAIKSEYSPIQLPLLVVVAESISASAILLLKALLMERSQEWQFNYQVITWKNNESKILIEGSYEGEQIRNSEIVIPVLPSTVKKRINFIDNVKIEEVFNGLVLNDEYQQLIKCLDIIGCKRKYQANSVNFYFPNQSQVLLGIWPFKSEKTKGVRVTISIDKFKGNVESLDSIGVLRSDDKLGFLGWNGFVKEEMTRFCNFLKEKG